MKKQNGFTIIEVLVYLGLFVVLISGGILAAYNIIESANRNQEQVLILDEGNFIIGKINFVLDQGDQIIAPSAGTTASLLQVINSDNSSHEIFLNNSNVFSDEYILNNQNILVSNLVFDRTTSLLKTSFILSAKTADGKSISRKFETINYLHK